MVYKNQKGLDANISHPSQNENDAKKINLKLIQIKSGQFKFQKDLFFSSPQTERNPAQCRDEKKIYWHEFIFHSLGDPCPK